MAGGGSRFAHTGRFHLGRFKLGGRFSGFLGGGRVSRLIRKPDGTVTIQRLAPTWKPVLTRNPDGTVTISGSNTMQQFRVRLNEGAWAYYNEVIPYDLEDVTADDAVEVEAIGAAVSLGAVVAPALSALTLSSAAITESAATGALVGTIQGVTSGSTLSLTDDAEGLFEISDGDIVTAGALDYETATSHDITIRETLAGASNTPRDTTLTITVTNVQEVTLIDLTLSASSVAEDASEGSIVGAVQGRTSGGSISLTDDAGGLFAISGSNLVTADALDFETAESHEIEITETHPDATTRTTTLTITVTDVDETGVPTINSNIEGGTFSVAESGTDYVITISGLGSPYDGEWTKAQSEFATGAPVEIVPVSFTITDNASTRVLGLWHAPEDDPAEFTPGYKVNDSVIDGLNTETLDLDPYPYDKVEIFEVAVNNAGEQSGSDVLMQAATAYTPTNVIFDGSTNYVEYASPGVDHDAVVIYHNIRLPDAYPPGGEHYTFSFGNGASTFTRGFMFPTALVVYGNVGDTSADGATNLTGRTIPTTGHEGKRLAILWGFEKNGKQKCMYQIEGEALVVFSEVNSPADKVFAWGNKMRLGAGARGVGVGSFAPFHNSRFSMWEMADLPVFNSTLADLLWIDGTIVNRAPEPSDAVLGTPLIDERGDATDFGDDTEFGSLTRAAKGGTFVDA